MSLIICSRCGRSLDSDFDDCASDPKEVFGLMCFWHEEEDAEEGLAKAAAITQDQYADTVNPLVRPQND